MNAFWHWWIIIMTVGVIAGVWWLIIWTSKPRPGESAEGEVTGHAWDGLEELNNPLPRWWLWMFYITIVYGVVYMLLYPGFGNFQGFLNWSSTGQYEQEMQQAEAEYGPIFAAFAQKSIPELAADPEAQQAGQRLFLSYCSQCHGSDAKGVRGYPNLADQASLYGNTPAAIKHSILDGRSGMMPPFGAALGEQGVAEMTAYVLSLSGREVDVELAAAAKPQYSMMCAACHGMEGKGNQMLGAPDLTDSSWLYGASAGAVKKSIAEGRQGIMPAHRDFLGEEKSHLLAAYVYHISQQ